jgi:hypothetical protein
MKRTSLLILMVVGLTTLSTVSNAQHGRFSLGLEVGLPMGDFGDFYNAGFGVTARYEHPIGDNIGIGLTTGWMVFGGQSIDVGGYTTDVSAQAQVPIQPFFKYYFTEQQRGFYAMAEIGVTMSATASTANTESSSSTDLSYAPGIGYCLDNFDFGLRYQMISFSADVFDATTMTTKSETKTNSFLGLRIAYVFGSPD